MQGPNIDARFPSIAFIELVLALVGGSLALVGGSLALVGVTLALIGPTLARSLVLALSWSRMPGLGCGVRSSII